MFSMYMNSKKNNYIQVQNDMANDYYEDSNELKWIYCELRDKFKSYEKMVSETDYLLNYYKFILEDLSERINSFKLVNNFFEEYYVLKNDMRTLFKQLAGLISSTYWESPSLDDYGILQIEKNTYSRRGGSSVVSDYAQIFHDEIYNSDVVQTDYLKGSITSSGMKSIELGLVFFKEISKKYNSSLYVQKNFYYEGLALAQNLFDSVTISDPEEIYEVIEDDKAFNCIMVDPGTTWPISECINLDILFELLSYRKSKTPIFIIVDITLINGSINLISKYENQINQNIIVCCVESVIKYLQYGMDLTNLGYLQIYSTIFKYKKYESLLQELAYLLTALPDQSSILRLPKPNKNILDIRMSRLGRNSKLYLQNFENLSDANITINVASSLQLKTSNNKNWVGSLLYIKLSEHFNYDEFIDELYKNKPSSVSYTIGGSFGFDRTRICIVEEKVNSNRAIRISVGKEPINVCLATIKFIINSLLEKGD